jgi:bisphosphoglycerate-independent phosphoglycerate mutase (AlkP superfamily)
MLQPESLIRIKHLMMVTTAPNVAVHASCHEVTADKGAAGNLNVGHLSLLAAAIPYERQLPVHTHHGHG